MILKEYAMQKVEVNDELIPKIAELVSNNVSDHLIEAEVARREKPLLDCTPVPGMPPCFDYGASGQAMELAMAHLRESVPNGQKIRTEHAWAALTSAVTLQAAWLRAKGYDV